MLSYPGNLGVAEVAQVYMFGTDEQIEKLEEIINENPFDEDTFIDYVEEVTGTRLHPLLVKPAREF